MFLNLSAHAVGEDRDAFTPPQRREQGLVAIHGWIKHLDEAAEFVAGSLIAGPAVACERKPAVELCAIVPIGDRHDVGEAGFVDIACPIPMRWTAIRVETGRDPRHRLLGGVRRRTAGLDAEIGHYHPLYARSVAG